MLTEWKVYNFKSIKELPPNFCLGPVTVLAGANSSGKTTLLQSILLMSQTLSSPVGTRALILNGEAVKLGTWSDVPHSDLQNEPVTFECSIDLSKEASGRDVGSEISARRLPSYRRRLKEGIDRVTLSVSFYSTQGRMVATPEPRIKKVRVGIQTSQQEVTGQRNVRSFSITVSRRLRRRKAHDAAKLIGLLPTGLAPEALNYRVTSEATPEFAMEYEEGPSYFQSGALSRTTIGATFRHFLPSSLVQKYDATAREFDENIRNLTSYVRPRELRQSGIHSLAAVMEKAMFKGKKRVSAEFAKYVNDILKATKFSERFKGSTSLEFAKFLAGLRLKARERPSVSNLYFLFSYNLMQFLDKEARQSAIQVSSIADPARIGTSELEDFFVNKIRYLGPLRDEPRVIYTLPPTPDIPDVGIKGEYTAAVLDLNKDCIVKFIDPATRAEKDGSLQNAVITWLEYMGVLESVSTQEAGKLGYKLTVRAPGLDRELDLTSVGVGASQVLPILVMSLLAPPGTLLIFEQPEIHLHPRVQSLLGDFFLSMGQLGKQCLVETHSEYLVNCLRQRIAEAEDDAILKLVKIYFVEREGSFSHFREVKANEYGAILEWPVGFFDEGALQAESMMRLGAKKRIGRTRVGSDKGAS